MGLIYSRQPWDGQPTHPVDLVPEIVGPSFQGVIAPRRQVGRQTPTVFTAADSGNKPGRVYSLTGSTGHIAAPTTATSAAWTYLVYGVQRASGVSALMTCAESPGSGTYDRGLIVGTSGALRGYIFDGGFVLPSAGAPTVGKPFLAAMVATGSNVTIYLDGVPGTTLSAANTGYTGYSTAELVIGYGGGGNGEDGGSPTINSTFDLAYALKIDKALPAGLIREIAKQPWSILEPRRILVPVASAGGSPFALTASTAVSVAAVGSISGDIQIGTTAALTASPVSLAASATLAGDIQIGTSKDISASALSVAASVSASGDIQIASGPTLDLSASTVSLAAAVSVAGDLAYGSSFDLAASALSLGASATVAGDIAASTEAVVVSLGGRGRSRAFLDRVVALPEDTTEEDDLALVVQVLGVLELMGELDG